MEGFARHDARLASMIVIIGGGWAGLACAAALCQRSEGPITLLETAPALGGRARGLIWNGRLIDNGQHLTIGAYRETFTLLDMVGAPTWHRQPLVWSGCGADRQISHQWRVPRLGWPWRALLGAVPGFTPRGWPIPWRKKMAAMLAKLSTDQWTLSRGYRDHGPHLTVARWLSDQHVPQGLIDHFWRPIAEGALNTEIESASAATLIRVLQDSLGGAADACDVLTPRRNLSIDGVDPIEQWLRSQGVQLLLGHRAVSLSQPSDGQWQVSVVHGNQQSSINARAVVMALPCGPSKRLWSDSHLPITSASRRWATMQHRAITTVWLALNDQQESALSQLPEWFVLNTLSGLPQVGQVVVRRPGAIGVVISAQANSSQHSGREQLASGLALQLRVHLGLDLETLDQKWITEKNATWACTVNAPRPSDQEQLGHTGIAGLFRAADDLVAGYPATIESAVRSGRSTAEQLLQRR